MRTNLPKLEKRHDRYLGNSRLVELGERINRHHSLRCRNQRSGHPFCHRGCIRESPSLPSRRRLNRYSPLLRQLHQWLLRWRGLVGIGMDRGLQTDRREKVPRYGRDHIRWYDNRLERRLRRRHFLEEESTALQELDCQQLILPYGDPFI